MSPFRLGFFAASGLQAAEGSSEEALRLGLKSSFWRNDERDRARLLEVEMREKPFMLIKNYTPKQPHRGKARDLRGEGSAAWMQRSGHAVPMRKRKINVPELGKQEVLAKESSFDLF